MKNFKELSSLETFEERYEYLKLDGSVGAATFGCDRYLNQIFYNTVEWRRIRRQVIIRDNGCDLGIPGREIRGTIYIHHMNSITKQDVLDRNPDILDPDFLVCVSDATHRAIHYGSDLPSNGPVERTANDTSPWR